jgi:hypothetical protein
MIGKQVTFMIIPQMLRIHGFDIDLRLFRSFIIGSLSFNSSFLT